MATVKHRKAAVRARRDSKGQRAKRTPPEPRQYTVADLERAQDRVEAAERRIANNHTSDPNRARAGLKRAQLELRLSNRSYACVPYFNEAFELLDHLVGARQERFGKY